MTFTDEQRKSTISAQLDMALKLGVTERELEAATEIAKKVMKETIHDAKVLAAISIVASGETIRPVLIVKAALALSLQALQNVPDEEGAE